MKAYQIAKDFERTNRDGKVEKGRWIGLAVASSGIALFEAIDEYANPFEVMIKPLEYASAVMLTFVRGDEPTEKEIDDILIAAREGAPDYWNDNEYAREELKEDYLLDGGKLKCEEFPDCLEYHRYGNLNRENGWKSFKEMFPKVAKTYETYPQSSVIERDQGIKKGDGK